MAKIIEIVVSRSVKINLGNYESLDHFLSVKAEVDELDDVPEEIIKLTAVVERAMVHQLVRSYKVRHKPMGPGRTARHHGLTYIPKEK